MKFSGFRIALVGLVIMLALLGLMARPAENGQEIRTLSSIATSID